MSNDSMPSHHGSPDESRPNLPNETIRLLHERSSCRSFENRPIPGDVLQMILEAGIHAPTGGNLQPYSIIKIENKDTKRELNELCGGQSFIETAPVDLLFCIDWHRIERWAKLETAPFSATSSFRHFWISFQDTVIAAQNICTAADAFGLGSVYVGTVIDRLREIRDICKLPKGVFPVVLLSLGYPKVRPQPKKKLGISAIVHDEVYRELPDGELRQAFEDKYPGLKIEITEERLHRIHECCVATMGEEFADQCQEAIDRQGYINAIQRYFGLHYCADIMPEGNDEYLRIMKEFGFAWFEVFSGAERQ